jgi:hypothetical protein
VMSSGRKGNGRFRAARAKCSGFVLPTTSSLLPGREM